MDDVLTFADDRERWSEQEAAFCDQMVVQFKTSSTEWTAKSHHPDSVFGALRCAIYAEAYQQMAWNLRKPRNCRIEREEHDTARAALQAAGGKQDGR